MSDKKLNTNNQSLNWNFRIFSAEVNYTNDTKKLNKQPIIKLEDWNIYEETEGFVLESNNANIKELSIDLTNLNNISLQSKENLKNFLDQNRTRFGHTLTLWYDIENRKILCWKAYFEKSLLSSIVDVIFHNDDVIHDLKQKSKILKSDFKNVLDQCFNKMDNHKLANDEYLKISARENCKLFIAYHYDSKDLDDKGINGTIKRIANMGGLTLDNWNIEQQKDSYVVPNSNKNIGEFNIDLSNIKKLNDIPVQLKNDLKKYLDKLKNKNANIAIWYDQENKKFIFNRADNIHDLKFAIMLSIWNNKDSIYDVKNQKNIYKNQYNELLSDMLNKNFKNSK